MKARGSTSLIWRCGDGLERAAQNRGRADGLKKMVDAAGQPWLIDWDRSSKTKANYHGLMLVRPVVEGRSAAPMSIRIESVHAVEILDSRGRPTFSVFLETGDGVSTRAGVPSGASKGSGEAVGLPSFAEALRAGAEVYAVLKARLTSHGYATAATSWLASSSTPPR